MAMSELKQKILLYELARIGFPDAEYMQGSGKIKVQPNNDRMPDINDAGDIRYGTEHDSFVVNTLKPVVDRVNEVCAAWDKSSAMPFENLAQFRVLAEYNNVMLAARDDTEHGRGLHFVTWQYDYNRTGLEHGHYTEDYNAAKEDFAERSGLIPSEKLFTPEQAAELITAVEYRIQYDGDITYATETALNEIATKLRDAYPGNDVKPIETSEQTREAETHVESMPASKTIFGDVQSGDWVIAAGNNDYRFLLGTVTAIDKLGSPEHGTDNETDDVHVDFTAFSYPLERIAEIEGQFSELYGEPKAFDELPLDDVIMAPKMLISISHLGHDEIERMGNLRQNCEAFCNCFPGGGEPQSERHAELIERLNKNLDDYYNLLDGFGNRELIDMAGKIAAMSDVHSCMTTTYSFDDAELDFYLQFQNPLEVVADYWNDYNKDISDISLAIDWVSNIKDTLLKEYPLMSGIEKPSEQSADNERRETPVSHDEEPVKPEKADKPAEKQKQKPKTLAEKMQAAQEKVKAQETKGGGNKTRKRGEIGE